MIEPFSDKQVREGVISYGLSSYGYDVRIADEFKIFTNINHTIVDPKDFDPRSFVDFKGEQCIIPPNSFALARTVEYFRIPRDVIVVCVGKSTYARCGIIVNVTPLEPEWEGIVTLEVSNTTPLPARIYANEGIAQVLFFEGDEPARPPTPTRRASTRPSRASPCPGSERDVGRRAAGATMVHETVTLEGHLIDSDILRRVFDRVVEEGGEFEVLEFRVGRTNDEPSFARIDGAGRGPAGARPHPRGPALPRGDDRGRRRVVRPRRGRRDPARRVLLHHELRHLGAHRRPLGGGAPTRRWTAPSCCATACPRCVKQGQVKQGEPVALRGPGIRVRPARAQPRLLGLRLHVERRLGRDQQGHRDRGHRRARCAARARRGSGSWWWPGPAIVHSGRRRARSPRLVREGWVDVILTGNAFAVHDLEKAIVGHEPRRVPDERPRGRGRQPQPPLRDQRGEPRWAGSGRRSRRASSKSGVMYEAVKQGHPVRARRLDPRRRPAHATRSPTSSPRRRPTSRRSRGRGLCLMLASALHSIAVGNLLPARVRTVCVDMTESVPVKLGEPRARCRRSAS